jgi:RHS repeat-associated protein
MRRLFWIALIGILFAPVKARAQSEEVVYFHTDAIGSVRMITDPSGAVLARYDYTPFGQPWTPPGTVEAMQFTGKERELQDGNLQDLLDHFVARDFLSFTGRFTIVDPGHVAGTPYDPQTWNAYSYALNNPFRFVDPFGLAPCPPPTSTSTCVEGRTGTGELVFDFPRWQMEAFFWMWWNWRNQEPEVMGAPIGPPIGSIGKGLIGLGLSRLGAATVRSETTRLLGQAAFTVGNRGAVATSEAAALRAAEEWVGIGARIIRSRSGQVVGKISADGQRLYRTTSLNKAQPYINLESKTSGGNLHIRW